MRSYRQLSADLIVKTLARLKARIDERFPERGLGAVAAALPEVAEKDQAESADLRRPYLAVRAGVAAFLIAGAAAQAAIFGFVKVRLGADWDIFNLFQGIEAALNTLLIMGAGVFFLMTLEERMKRRRALEDLHELRSISHVIDMHQLTKDPTSLVHSGPRTRSSPAVDMTPFELTRYLDYCAELLALVSKLAALYAQSTRDSVVIQAVNEIEDLTTALSGKIWQKIETVRSEMADEEDEAAAVAVAPAEAQPGPA